jgi:glutamate N-acetyltransferase/amino-acid N-acetyltransferase
VSVTDPEGFVAAGGHIGIKASGADDLAIVATDDGQPVVAAGVFTQNLACAGPVRVSRAHLDATGGQASAVVLNSGNANCATGTDVAVAEEMAAVTAAAIGAPSPQHVLVCSTGLIGVTLDPAPLRDGIPTVARSRSRTGGLDAARAIMTTDTVAKTVTVEGDGWKIGGIAKGAAMLAPNMATMLAVLTTDAAVDPTTLRADLQYATGASFNRVVVDGCTSTNDTVLVLANGRAGAPDPVQFSEALAIACLSLARQMTGDAEGHTKVVTVEVAGAADDGEAERAARKLATSVLVKCSFYGEDPYWGRVLSDLGTAGVALDTDAITIAYDDVVASKGLAPTGADASGVLARPAFTLRCDLGVGTGSWFLLTNDLSHAYIDENMGTS